MLQVPARIGGRPVGADEWIEVRSPFDGAPVARVPALSAEHVAEAVARAGGTDCQRAEVLERAADLLADRTEEFAVTVTREAGTPIVVSRAEAARAVATLRQSAADARKPAGRPVPITEPDQLGMIVRRPVGVVAVLTSHDSPLGAVARRLGPAIAAGCPVVLKPAASTPVSAVRLVDLLVEAGLPADAVAVLTGTGPVAGVPLVSHPVPAVVAFAGSVAAGQRVRAAAVGKRVLCEPDATVPLLAGPGADPGRVVAELLRAGLHGRWVLAHREVHDGVLHLLREAVASLRAGDPLDARTHIGPMISPEATAEAERHLAAARDAGAEVTGGVREGSVLTPAVVAGAPGRPQLSGPVVAVTRFTDLDETIAQVNGAAVRPRAGVFTPDLAVALRSAHALDFDEIQINRNPSGYASNDGLVDALTERRIVMVTP
ncbi:aldehyde dehydrogenase family protein [Actinoplanes rectilineatus]|uniref:aldehyde dehydrogenase family protein n=1 Tax=Actinoplanes rectilineatus TaxID=113571 RepID=UPI000A9C4662|nr:aldehyde dehydrogenase family protein [Actinoplanes rectilineatus]